MHKFIYKYYLIKEMIIDFFKLCQIMSKIFPEKKIIKMNK